MNTKTAAVKTLSGKPAGTHYKTNYNKDMEKRRPEIIFSTLTGIAMLIFMLASLTDRDFFQFEIDVFGSTFGMGISSMELLIPFTAVVIDIGMYQALHTHLPVSDEQIGLHLFLPFAVTLTIGFTIRNIRTGLAGWGLLFLTGVLLYLVLRFEYVACDPASALRPVSVIILDGLCYAIFLLFIIALRANVSPLVITLPAIFILCAVISLKIYSFHIINGQIFRLTAVTAFVMVFADVGLHYWPIHIVSYGSLMFIWYYVFVNLVIGADNHETSAMIMRRILPVVVPALIVTGYAIINL